MKLKNEQSSSEFRKPILSQIYEVGGTFCIVIATLFAIGGVAVSFQQQQGRLGFFFANLNLALGIAFVGLLALGIAQVINATVETAFNTRDQSMREPTVGVALTPWGC